MGAYWTVTESSITSLTKYSPNLLDYVLSSFPLSCLQLAWTTQVLKIVVRYLRLPWWLDGKKPACNVGDLGSIPGLGRFSGGGHGNPLQYSCLENPNGQRSLVWATVHGVAWGRRNLPIKPPSSSQSCFLYNNFFCLLINGWTTKHNTGWIYVDIA